MAWKTTKDGRHFNTDWIDRERQITQNRKEAEERNSQLSEEEATAVRQYIGSYYSNMNADLRGGYSLSSKSENRKKLIDSAISKQVLDKPMTVYRGVSGEVFGVARNIELKEIEPFIGKTVWDKAFMSTSFEKEGAFHDDILFNIKIPAGKGIGIDISKHLPSKRNGSAKEREAEFLIARDSGLKILRIKRINDRFEIDAELIPKYANRKGN